MIVISGRVIINGDLKNMLGIKIRAHFESLGYLEIFGIYFLFPKYINKRFEIVFISLV